MLERPHGAHQVPEMVIVQYSMRGSESTVVRSFWVALSLVGRFLGRMNGDI
jgi:hypothetical protein